MRRLHEATNGALKAAYPQGISPAELASRLGVTEKQAFDLILGARVAGHAVASYSAGGTHYHRIDPEQVKNASEKRYEMLALLRVQPRRRRDLSEAMGIEKGITDGLIKSLASAGAIEHEAMIWRVRPARVHTQPEPVPVPHHAYTVGGAPYRGPESWRDCARRGSTDALAIRSRGIDGHYR